MWSYSSSRDAEIESCAVTGSMAGGLYLGARGQAARRATRRGRSLTCMRSEEIVSRFDSGRLERHSWQTRRWLDSSCSSSPASGTRRQPEQTWSCPWARAAFVRRMLPRSRGMAPDSPAAYVSLHPLPRGPQIAELMAPKQPQLSPKLRFRSLSSARDERPGTPGQLQHRHASWRRMLSM